MTGDEQQTMLRGTLIRGIGSFYTVVTPDHQQYTLRCKKKFRHEKISPLVGDEVMFSPGSGEEHGWIEEILPRLSESVRPPAANVTLLLLTISPIPQPDLLLIDRLMVRARRQGMKVALIATKADLDASLSNQLKQQYADVPVIQVCAETGLGFDELKELMRGELCCMAGQSGVGKSTLLSALLGMELETGDISRKIQRGKNTTRRAELLMKDGLKVLDTAGFSLLQLEGGTEPITLKESYPEFIPFEGQCRFNPCFHDREPGCAVTQACKQGMIDPNRLERYRLLLSEVREAWKERYD